MDKINVLLIDDKPESLFLYQSDAKPTINFLELSVVADQYKGAAAEFELEWLQSLNDIKEYRFFNSYVENNLGLAQLKKKSFVPDILLFDYNFQFGIDDSKKAELLNCKLAKSLGFMSYRDDTETGKNKYSQTGITLWEEFVDKNAFGCFAGAIITLDFKDNACVGLPTTSYTDEGFHGKEAIQYFEDLLRADFGDAFEIKGRSNPRWQDLLAAAMDKKRIRILQMAREYKLSFDFQNLLNLKSWSHCKNEKGERGEKGFYFSTVYGSKEVNLDALFLDKKQIPARNHKSEDPNIPTNVSERDKAIQEFAESIFNVWFETSKDYELVESTFTKIWDTYKTDFGKIIDLSELHLRQEYFKQKLSVEEQDLYKKLASEFVDPHSGDFRKDKVTSLFEIHHSKLSKRHKRVVCLLLATKAVLTLQSLRNQNKLPPELQNDFSPEEMSYVFSPVRSEYSNYPLILSMHIKEAQATKKKKYEDKEFSDDKSLRAEMIEKTKESIGTLVGDSTKKERALKPEDYFIFERWITKSEKALLQTFFARELSKLSIGDHPEWLK